MESMTGFGRAYHQLENFQIFCLAKSINHRYLEISLKLPRRYILLEERMRRKVAQFFERGKIEILLKIYGLSPQGREVLFDLELAQKLRDNLKVLSEHLGLTSEITLGEILQFREIVLIEEREEDLEVLWEEVNPALEEALQDLKNSRLLEGSSLKEKISEYLSSIHSKLTEIATLKEKIKEENIKKMQERVSKLLKEFQGRLDETRLYQEISILLDKIDFSEELDRFTIHLNTAFHLLSTPNPGKKLDFLCQELMREITTLSNKAQSAEISLRAVEIKELVEKIREQVQNIV